eukprot:767709-Hanusia_phi.AAC.2
MFKLLSGSRILFGPCHGVCCLPMFSGGSLGSVKERLLPLHSPSPILRLPGRTVRPRRSDRTESGPAQAGPPVGSDAAPAAASARTLGVTRLPGPRRRDPARPGDPAT